MAQQSCMKLRLIEQLQKANSFYSQQIQSAELELHSHTVTRA
jgi:hypothetical protein